MSFVMAARSYCRKGFQVRFSLGPSRIGGSAVALSNIFEDTLRRVVPTSQFRHSNLPFEGWTEVLGSERLTGATLDRLTHRCHIVETRGELSTDKTESVAKSFYSVGSDKLVVNLSLEYEGVPFSSKSSKMVLMTKVARDRNVPKVLPTLVTPHRAGQTCCASRTSRQAFRLKNLASDFQETFGLQARSQSQKSM